MIQGKVEREEMGPYTALPKLTALTKYASDILFVIFWHISLFEYFSRISYQRIIVTVNFIIKTKKYFFKRVFTTVVSGLGEFFSPGREAKITSGYISDVSILNFFNIHLRTHFFIAFKYALYFWNTRTFCFIRVFSLEF